MTAVIVPPAAAAVPALGVSDGEDLSWQERGLCTQMDPEAFFPEKGGSTREAKKVCRGCEVRVECLEYAMEHDERFGIWGGLSERERRRMRHVDFTPTGPALAPAPSGQAPAEGHEAAEPGPAQQATLSPAASLPAPDADGPAPEPELVAACRQRDLNPADRAMAMGALARKGYTHARICARTGLSAATVRKHMALLDLDEASLGRVRSGQLSLDRAVAAVQDARALLRSAS